MSFVWAVAWTQLFVSVPTVRSTFDFFPPGILKFYPSICSWGWPLETGRSKSCVYPRKVASGKVSFPLNKISFLESISFSLFLSRTKPLLFVFISFSTPCRRKFHQSLSGLKEKKGGLRENSLSITRLVRKRPKKHCQRRRSRAKGNVFVCLPFDEMMRKKKKTRNF